MDPKDKRKYVRIDCLMAGRIVSIGSATKTDMNQSTALTKNVSAGGLLFKDVHRYNMGDLVVIEVDTTTFEPCPDKDVHFIKIRGCVLGKIVRVEEFDDGHAYDYGVCFIRSDDREQDYFAIFQALLNKMEFDG